MKLKEYLVIILYTLILGIVSFAGFQDVQTTILVSIIYFLSTYYFQVLWNKIKTL